MPYTDQGLPFAPGSHTSFKAAIEAQEGHATKTARYLALVKRQAHSDHEAAAALNLPLSSICSIRNSIKDLLVKDGQCESPYGRTVDRWRTA